MRRENDRLMFEGAFADLVSVLGIHMNTGEAEAKERAAKGAIKEILVSLGANAVLKEIFDIKGFSGIIDINS